MEIYKKNNDKIEIYSMSLSPNAREYKVKEMQSIDEDSRVLSLVRSMDLPYREIKAHPGNLEDLIHFHDHPEFRADEIYNEWNWKLQPSLNSESILNKFYNGEYPSSSVSVKKCACKLLKYYLLTDKREHIVPIDSDLYLSFYDGIINLPESLYLLWLLESGEFRKAFKSEVGTQLSCFDISEYPVGTLDLRVLEKSNISCDLISRVNEKIVACEPIFTYVKR